MYNTKFINWALPTGRQARLPAPEVADNGGQVTVLVNKLIVKC